MKRIVAAAFVAGVVFGGAGLAWTQTGKALPGASVTAAHDIPGAHELPDPNMNYKVAFSRVCGQGLVGRKIDQSQVLPDIQVDLWAMTTMVNLQLRGYVRIGG